MVESMQKIVNRDNHSEEEEEDFGDEQLRLNFATPEGLPIPGVSHEDTAYSKIEAVHIYLEQELGVDKMISACAYITDPPEGEEDSEHLKQIIGADHAKFIPLIYQLIVYSENYYSNG
jgi:hypothetical protein